MADPGQWLRILGPGVDQACALGLLPDPGLEVRQISDLNLANSRNYILALSARLIDLGYVRESLRNRSKSKMDPYLANGVKKFQQEAGLEADRWAGPETWQVLDQLVSFENDQDPETWRIFAKGAPEPGPALARAVYLRLWVLGFFDWQAPLGLNTDLDLGTNTVFFSALDRFLETAWQLGLTRNRLAPGLGLEVVRPLFAQDELVRRLADQPGFAGDKSHRTFVEAVARIELWLAGFAVTPGRPGVRLKKRETHGVPRRLSPLAEALAEFWSLQPKTCRPGLFSRQTVSRQFFAALVKMEGHGREDPGQDLVDQVCGMDLPTKSALMSGIREAASSIWDGFRRMVRWVVLGIRQMFLTAASLVKNLARFIARQARQAFEQVRRVVEVVHRGAVYFKNRDFSGSAPAHCMIRHDKDFDMSLFDNGLGDPGVKAQVLAALKRESRCFAAACRILGHLAAVFSLLVTRLGTGSWLALLLSLTRLFFHLESMAEEVRLLSTLDLTADFSPFSNPVS